MSRSVPQSSAMASLLENLGSKKRMFFLLVCGYVLVVLLWQEDLWGLIGINFAMHWERLNTMRPLPP